MSALKQRQPRLAAFVLAMFLTVAAFSYLRASGTMFLSFYDSNDGAAAEQLRAEVEREVKAKMEKDLKAKVAQELGAAKQLELDAALARRVCPIYKPGDNRSFSFLHIPKTAGNLLVNTLAAMMPQDSPGRWCARGEGKDMPEVYHTCSVGSPDAQHELLLNMTRQNFLKTCSGFGAHQDSVFFEAVGVDPKRTVTMVALRHPVDRVISDYYYSLKMQAPWLRRYKPLNDSDFTGLMLFSKENLKGLGNFETQMLGGARHCEWPGMPPPTDMDNALEVAKRNLEQSCVILLTEYMDESMLRLAAAAGWSGDKFMQVSQDLEAQSKAELGGRINANTKPHVPPHVRQAIAESNALDMQLYEYAVQLFLRQRDAAPERKKVTERQKKKRPGL